MKKTYVLKKYSELLESSQEVLRMLASYEKNGSKVMFTSIKNRILYDELLEETYDAVYCFNNPELKSAVIKKAPKDWIKRTILQEEDTNWVGAMLDRVEAEDIKMNAYELTQARNWQLRMNAAKYTGKLTIA